MRATLLGHATWLVETQAGPVLTDPVFFDPFEQGAVVSCPKRAIDVDALPKPVAIYLSHRHIDHYDFRSLDLLDRATPVLCPPDDLLRQGLREIGFHDLRDLAPFEPVVIGPLKVVPVPSYSDELNECGAVFDDGTGTLYNQVDCPLDTDTLSRLKALYPQIDVHLSMFASQSFGFFESKTDDIAAVHASNIHAAAALGARLVVPGSAGFRFADSVGWLNRHLFPISSDRFARDLRKIRPDLDCHDVLPGDVLELEGGKVVLRRRACPFARTVDDDRHLIDYDASAPVPPLVDDNESGYDADFLKQVVRGLLDSAIVPYLQQLQPGQDDVVDSYVRHQASYRLRVVYPDGDADSIRFAFGPQGLSVSRDDAPGDVQRAIAASALCDVLTGRKSAFWARTRSRRSALVIAIGPDGDRVAFDDIDLRDLLMHLLVNLRGRKVGTERALREYLGLYPPEAMIQA